MTTSVFQTSVAAAAQAEADAARRAARTQMLNDDNVAASIEEFHGREPSGEPDFEVEGLFNTYEKLPERWCQAVQVTSENVDELARRFSRKWPWSSNVLRNTEGTYLTITRGPRPTAKRDLTIEDDDGFDAKSAGRVDGLLVGINEQPANPEDHGGYSITVKVDNDQMLILGHPLLVTNEKYFSQQWRREVEFGA